MNDLLQLFKSQYPDFKNIEVNPIFNAENEVVGYNATAFLSDDFPIGGGTHSQEKTALRICIAESLERAFFKQIKQSSHADEFLIQEYPSTCGFALGFNNEKTKMRALAEALERWAWSKWIDNGFALPEVSNIQPEFDRLTKEYFSRFSGFRAFRQTFELEGQKFTLGIFLGFANGGVFAGSRVCGENENPWPHAIVEAYRNLSNYRNAKDSKKTLSRMTIVRERVINFGDHPEEALKIIDDQIRRSQLAETLWPLPKIRLLKRFNTNFEQVFLWRALCHDWIGWDKGTKKRFVY